MEEKRKGEIAYQLLKLNLRRTFSFRDIANAKREIGNISKEVDVPKDELLEFGKLILREVFEEQMAGL
jgi:hypothetical protein